MTLNHWLIFLVTAVGLSLTPGPNGLLALSNGARLGLRTTVPTILGGAVGFFILIAASLAGMGALLAASESAFTIAKLVGAAYLIYLGIKVWRAPPSRVDEDDDGHLILKTRSSYLFGQGFLVSVSNPKGLIFFAAFLPQFMVAGAPYLTQLLIFGGTFVIVEVIYELMLAGLAQQISPWFAIHGRAFNRITGGAFVGLGAVLATADRVRQQ